MRIAHLSTFPPLRCGIASFASDLIGAVPSARHDRYVLHYGAGATHDYAGEADVNSVDRLIALGRAVSGSDCDVVSLQHEFGIWGGLEGEHIFSFLDHLSKPLVSILHTSFGPGVRSEKQREIIGQVVERSARVVVFTEAALRTTEALLDRPLGNAVVIPHGVPAFPYREPPAFGTTNSPALRLITPGYYRPDKGLEVVVRAVSRLRLRGHDVSYVIAGEPQRQFEGQDGYFRSVSDLVKELNLDGAVRMVARYLSVEEQARVIQDSHVGIFAYQEPSQSSSGTVPLVLSLGRPVLCTPFEYAQAKQDEDLAVTLADGFDEGAVAEAIVRFLERDGHSALARRAYERTRSWIWSDVGRAFEAEYKRAATRLPSPMSVLES